MLTPMSRLALVLGLAVVLVQLHSSDAAAHFKFGQYSYEQRNSSGCRIHIDPITVIFYGSRGHLVGSRHNIVRHLDWRNKEGGNQYFASHGRCYPMDSQRADGGGDDERYHVRLKQAPHKDDKGRWETVGTAHHEEHHGGLFGCGHAVNQNGSSGGSGFNRARRYVARKMKRKNHTTKYVNWGNTEKFRQCDDQVASSNGLVAWINIPHIGH